jgi:predicted ATPase/DNA-binding XRE family transcriptional regulator
MTYRGSFGHWLRQRRKALDLTQADLADQVGCSTITIRKIEADERRPSKQISERMADVLAIAPDKRAAFLTFARRVDNHQTALSADVPNLTPPHNLPAQSTLFIGREAELAQIAERLDNPTCRLLTLVGPGGIGKTRLALQAATDQFGAFTDGVYFVSLTPVGTTTLIPAAIASALQFSFYGQEAPETQLIHYLRGKHMLLLLDNYEHLLAGVDLLTDMLVNAPRIKLLVTSRERLRMQEEWVLPVAGLPFPAQDSDDLHSYSAVELFVQTARRLEPGFSLNGNQAGVVAVCRAVEGMPLGIELAATWLRVMPCAQIAAQIRHDLDFLATPLRNVPERHRSLRAVFEHSWGLLSNAEQGVVMRLSVFRGGCDAAAAEQVAGASLTLLASLVDKSLARVNGHARYEMHELLRQFAADKLLESGQAAETRQRHLHYYLDLAEILERQLFGPPLIPSLERLEIELDNFRAALDWAAQNEDAELGLRLAGALGWFWNRRARWHEGRAWLEMFVTADDHVPLPARAKAVHHILELNMEIGNSERNAALYQAALRLAHQVQDTRVAGWLFCSLGWVAELVLYDPEACLAHHEEALARFRQLGDQWGICETLSRVAAEGVHRGDYAHAHAIQIEAIKLARAASDKGVLSWLLMMSGCNHWIAGIVDARTESLYEESLELFRELGYKNGSSVSLCLLGKIAHVQGDDKRAIELLKQSLALCQQVGNIWYRVHSLFTLASVFASQNEAERGAQLLGAVSDLVQKFTASSLFADQLDRLEYEHVLAAVYAALDESAFAAAFAEGQTMPLDEATALALADSTLVEAT